MIKQLKKRVVFAAMISVTLVLVLIIGAINMLNYQSIIRDLDDVLYSIHENDGQIPEAVKDRAHSVRIGEVKAVIARVHQDREPPLAKLVDLHHAPVVDPYALNIGMELYPL